MEENKNQTGTTGKHKLHFAALFLILVILPIGTWYYTKSGFDYFKSMVGELHEYGKIPTFSLSDQNGEILQLEDIKGHLTVSSFIDLENDKSKVVASQIQKLYDQFRDRDDVVFLFYTTNPNHDSVEALNTFANANGLTDEEQCFFLTGNEASLKSMLSNGYKWPTDYGKPTKEEALSLASQPANGEGYYPYVVLADTSMMIRNYYTFEDNTSMARLVEHLAVLLPSRSGGKPEMKREKER